MLHRLGMMNLDDEPEVFDDVRLSMRNPRVVFAALGCLVNPQAHDGTCISRGALAIFRDMILFMAGNVFQAMRTWAVMDAAICGQM